MSESLMTRTEVSRLLGVSTKTLSKWEREGKIPPPARDWRGWRGYTHDQLAGIRDYLVSLGRSAPAIQEQTRPSPSDPLSARNRLRGVITRIEIDGLMAEVTVRLGDGQEVVAVITRSSVTNLDLHEGSSASAVIKATEVMIGR